MTTFLEVSNRASGTLDGNIDDVALELDVGAGEGVLFPDAFPFHITIEDEILRCTNRVGDTLTVVRAQQGTVAVAHTSGEDVQLRITAQNISDLNTAVNTLEAKGLTIAETEVHTGDGPTSWTDLDLNATIGSNAALVLLKIIHTEAAAAERVAVRKNGDTDEFYATTDVPHGVACGETMGASVSAIALWCPTDASGVIEWRIESTREMTVDVMAYIK